MCVRQGVWYGRCMRRLCTARAGAHVPLYSLRQYMELMLHSGLLRPAPRYCRRSVACMLWAHAWWWGKGDPSRTHLVQSVVTRSAGVCRRLLDCKVLMPFERAYDLLPYSVPRCVCGGRQQDVVWRYHRVLRLHGAACKPCAVRCAVDSLEFFSAVSVRYGCVGACCSRAKAARHGAHLWPRRSICGTVCLWRCCDLNM